MQIERIYQPDMPSQMRAIMLLLGIRFIGQSTMSIQGKENGILSGKGFTDTPFSSHEGSEELKADVISSDITRLSP